MQQTAASHQPASAGASADEPFHLSDPAEIAAQLRQLVGGDLPVTLRVGESSYTTALWAEDVSSGLLVFSADPASPAVQALAAAGHAMATAQIDQVDLRFELSGVRLIRARTSSALHARYPASVCRMQRREAFRVRPLDHVCPMMRFVHPQRPDLDVCLPVLDMSFTGLALRLPDDMPTIEVGTHVAGMLELDGFTELPISLRVMRQGAGGRDIGCEIAEVAPQRARTLQRYIEQTQRRRHMLTL